MHTAVIPAKTKISDASDAVESRQIAVIPAHALWNAPRSDGRLWRVFETFARTSARTLSMLSPFFVERRPLQSARQTWIPDASTSSSEITKLALHLERNNETKATATEENL